MIKAYLLKPERIALNRMAFGGLKDDEMHVPEDWPFDQAPNVAAITTVNVLDRGAPILRVTHYADDHSWAFVCGLTNDDADGRVIGMGTALRIDPMLRDIADLPPGWTAWREHVGAAWHRVCNPMSTD